MSLLPKVLLIGGPDLDARLEFMRCLRPGYEVSALGASPDLHAKFQAEGFQYDHYELSRQINPVADLVAVGQLTNAIRRLQPTIVHTFDTKPGVWGCLAARLAGVPIIISTVTGLGSLYTTDNLKTRVIRGLYQGLQSLACRLADVTIFQNHTDARYFIDQGVVSSDKTRVILGSGVSTSTFDPRRISDEARARVRQELGIQPDEVVVTMISRVIRTKGVLEFVAAAQSLRPRYPQTRFLLIGPNDTQSLDRLTQDELDWLEKTVTWPGARRDIPTILAVSDLFVFPTLYREGIPRVLLEAAAMGLPIVTTDSPGCNEVVHSGVNGFLVKRPEPAALAEAIGPLIEQPDLRYRFGQISRRRAVERFDIMVITDQVSSVYEQRLVRKALLPTME